MAAAVDAAIVQLGAPYLKAGYQPRNMGQSTQGRHVRRTVTVRAAMFSSKEHGDFLCKVKWSGLGTFRR